jgi:hypothetical protein
MATSIVSVLTGIPIHRQVAMTGEITLPQCAERQRLIGMEPLYQGAEIGDASKLNALCLTRCHQTRAGVRNDVAGVIEAYTFREWTAFFAEASDLDAHAETPAAARAARIVRCQRSRASELIPRHTIRRPVARIS